MSIRVKTRNRLLLLLSVAVVGTGALAGAYYVRRSYLNASALRDREAGLKAIQTDDYANALTDLGRYLGRFNERPEAKLDRYAEALYNYALSRQMLVEPKSAHLVTAVALWKRYLNLESHPKEAEARHHLLDALFQLGWVPEALDTAETILKTEPTDLKSMVVRTEALNFQHKFSDAQTAAENWAKAYPNDLDAHLSIIQAMGQQDPNHASERFAKYAADLLASDPKNPMFELLASMAAGQDLDLKDKKTAAPKLAQAAKLALAAASSDLGDAKIVQRLARQLDVIWVNSIIVGSQQEFGVAGKGLGLASRSLEAHPTDLEYMRVYAFELLQANHSEQVQLFLDKVATDAAKADGRLLALNALVQFNLGLRSKGEALLTAAAKQGAKEPALVTLCDAMRAVFVTPAEDAAAMADLQAALDDSSSPLENCKAKLRAFVGARSDGSDELNALKTALSDAALTRPEIRTRLDAYRKVRIKAMQETCKIAAAMGPVDPLAQYLLGEASVRAGDADTAAKALSQALSLAPAWVQANLRMAQLAAVLRQGDVAMYFADIARALAPDDPNTLANDALISASNAVAGHADSINKALTVLKELQQRFPDKVPADIKRQIVLQLSRLGRDEDAAQFLVATATPGQPQTATRPSGDTLLLAQLYTNQKRYPEAQALYDQLLVANPSAQLIQVAADLADTLGQKEKVAQIMARLESLKMQPDDREMIWANFYARHGTPQQAVDRWQAALKANPNNATAWRRLLGYCLGTSSDQFDGAANFRTYFSQARKIDPPIPALSTLAPLQDAPGRKRDGAATPSILEEMIQDGYIRPLIIALLESSESDTPAIAKCLEVVAKSQKDIDALPDLNPSSIRPIQDKLIAEIQKLADNNPSVLPVQNFLIAFLGLSGQYDQCVAMATHVMQSFPNNPAAPAQAASRVLGAAGRWDDVLAVAKEWRQRSLAQPMAADLNIAAAYLKLRKPNDAIASLTDPYLKEIKENRKTPDDYDQVYIRYLQALMDADQSDVALQAITPLLKDRRWRLLWMQYMADLPDDKFAAASLAKLASSIPGDANDERVTLAVAWNVLASRTKSASYEKTAFGILDQLNSSPTSQSFLQDFGRRALAAPQDNMNGVILWARWHFAKTTMADSRKALLPLLDSIAGRLTWINLAADISGPADAAQWLNVAADAIDRAADTKSAALSQKLQLAQSLKALADRPNMPAALKTECLKSAVTQLEPVASAPGTGQLPQKFLALIYEDQENYAAAADIYRQVLAANEDVVSMNNLANLLAKMGKAKDAPEAARLVASAIKLQPRVPSFFDTQAAVYAILAKDYPNALQSIQQAIALDPAGSDWRVTRIWILSLSGQRPTAASEFNDLKRNQDLSRLSPDSQQRLRDAGLQ